MTPSTKIDQDTLPSRLVVGLSKLGLAMKSRTWRRRGRKGTGPLQLQIMTLLKARPNRMATVSMIARELSVQLPTASEAIKTLERKRLVRRRRREVDNRIVTVHLTAKGEKESHMASGWPEVLAAAAKELSPPEQADLLATLVKLIRSLQLRGEIAVARMCVSCRHFRPHVHAEEERPHHCDFYDVSFGDRSLRLDCHDYSAATAAHAHEKSARLRPAISA